MPLYEFYCEACDNRFEVRRSLSQGTDGVVCPACAGSQVRRIFTAVAAFSSDNGGQRLALSSGCSGCTAVKCSGCPGARRR